tara:strand:+ start:41 stop:1300 length:1260 start_codon:yes stop_codon:yes gene_type:complete
MPISDDTKELFTRTAIGINKQYTYIVPLPDVISFYDKNFKEVNLPNNDIERENTPYFICKYFNPDRFNTDGDRDDIDTIEDSRMEEWKKAGDIIIQNQNYTCSSKINKGFFDKDKLTYDTDIIILLYVFSGYKYKNAVLNGFVMCDDLNILPEGTDEDEAENSLYIDAICSNPRRPKRLGQDLPNVSFGRKLLDNVKDLARSKEYYGLTLSSLMYIINYYRKYGFRHLPKLNGEIQHEDDTLKRLADNNLKFKFSDDTEMEDLMWVELTEKTLHNLDTPRKVTELKKYWDKRDNFDDMIDESEKEKELEKLLNIYNENYIGTDIGKFILELEKQGFSTERVHKLGHTKRDRQSKRQMLKTMNKDSDVESSWNEGFKMSYSFANEGEIDIKPTVKKIISDLDQNDAVIFETISTQSGGKK